MHSRISRRGFLAALPVPAALLAAKPTGIRVGIAESLVIEVTQLWQGFLAEDTMNFPRRW
jgi:hypothetical protein